MNKSDCIVFDDVTIAYGTEEAVRNISFSVPNGEVFAIVGESGSGKSKITAAEIRGDINKKLRELGALTYKSEVHGTDNSQQIKLIVSEISDLKDNLDVVNEHIAVAKDQRRCPGCNAVIPKNSVFCNICGIKIDDADEDFEL